MTRIACVSDLHEHLPEVPECDILIVAGDLTFSPPGDLASQQEWIIGPFKDWCRTVPVKDEIVVVAGNHDQCIEQWGWPPGYMPCMYLQDEEITVDGLKIWGTPWQPWFYSWAFNAPQKFGEQFLESKFAAIPDDTDIIICHGPPQGYGDQVGDPHVEDRSSQPRVGSPAMTATIQRVKPKLMVCGHIHSGYGRYELGPTTIINGALVNHEYVQTNAIQVVNV